MRMGAGFGFVGLLVVVGIIVWAFSESEIPKLQKGREAQKQAEQISGRGPDGQPAAQSVKLDPKAKGGRTESLVVSDITPGGALEQYFGLQKGDEIIQIGPMKVPDWGGDEVAIAMVHEAAQRNHALVVRRNGQTVTLESKGPAGQLNNIKIPMH